MVWKKVKFKGSNGIDRLHRIRALCTSLDTKLDGVLIIGGVDSLHSQTSQAVLKYLFLGTSGQELLGDQVILQEHECLEDIILLICPLRVSIFYSSESDAAVKILPVISKWRHGTEYVVHDGMNLDEQESRKVSAFKRMIMGIKCVGVPFGIDQHGTNFQDTMLFEKWPLVQSYGHEGRESKTKGFMTMNHRVVNISREIMQVMGHLDTFSAKRLVQESQPFLAHHFDAFLQKLDHAESPDVRSTKSEWDLGEDLLSVYEFGTMQYSARGLDISPTRGSRVLFGVRTSVLTEMSSPKATVANSGVGKNIPATHMVVQAEDPLTGVRFARTYFLSSGKMSNQIVDENSLIASSIHRNKNVPKSTIVTKTLIDMYALLVHGFMRGAAKLICGCMGDNLTSLDRCLESARAEAIQTMVQMDKVESQLLGSQKLPAQFLDDQLHITAELMDARGQCNNSLTKDWCLLYCSMTLANIPSDADSALSLGSLFIGDTFLFRGRDTCGVSALATKRVLNVTKTFAYYRSWIQNGEEAKAADVLMRTLQSEFILQSQSVRLCKELIVTSPGYMDADKSPLMPSKATLLFNSELLPLVHGNWRVFTGGFVFSCPNFNPLIVSIERSVESFLIIPSPFEDLVLLKMVLKQDEYSYLTPLSNVFPIPLNSKELYIPLLSSSRFQNEVFQALESWKVTAAALRIPVYRANDLNEQLQGGDREGINFDIPSQLMVTCEKLVFKQTFVGQDARTLDSFFPHEFSLKDPSKITTLSLPNAENRGKLDILVTVMIGIPGSGVQALSELVCKISSSSYEWVSLVVDLRDLELVKQHEMETFGFLVISDKIARALDQIKKSTETLHLVPRILISITGFIDPITVTCAVRRGAHDASLTCKIGAFITCVSAVNVYLPDPLATQAPFPKVFDQMTAGFVTHSVVTNSSYVSEAVLQRLRYRMDQVNPFTDVMVLSHDVFEGPLTSLLTVDRFESAYYKQYRSFHFPNWNTIVGRDNASPVNMRYIADLEPAYSPVSFRFEIAPGMDRSIFLQKITKILTPFATIAKSKDRIHPIERKNMKGIRIAQAIAIDKVRQNVPDSTILSAMSCIEGVVLNGQSRLCWCVEGQVVFKDEPDCVYEYLSTGTLARLWVNPEYNKKSTTHSSMMLKITGQGLNAEKLRQLLLNCYLHAEPSPNQSRSKASISRDEKREIQRQHATDPLPEGYMFDGTNYVDFFGGRYEFHPCIAQFIDEYITAANDDRNATNMKASDELESQQCFVKYIS